MKTAVAVALVSLVLTPLANSEPGTADIDPLFANWVTPTSPGCSVAVSRNGQEVISRAYGLSNLDYSVPIGVQTRFEAGSVTKQFVAAALLMLAEEGRLSLNDEVHRYVPELPNFGPRLTLDHLLTHTSGLGDWNVLGYVAGWGPWNNRRSYTQEEALEMVVRQHRLNFAPGSAFGYSNSGYLLAAVVVERVSRQKLRNFLQQRIFGPLRMSATELRDDSHRVLPDLAVAYRQDRGAWFRMTALNDSYGPGGIITTPHDLLLWNEALENQRLGSFVTQELQHPAATSDGRPVGYARGLFTGRHKGAVEISHGGLIAGFQTTLLRYPEHRLSVALQCNSLSARTGEVARRIADLYLPAPATKEAHALADPPQRPAMQLTQEQAGRLAGIYLDEQTGLSVSVTVRDGTISWAGRTNLIATSTKHFYSQDGRQVDFSAPGVATLTSLEGNRSTYRRYSDVGARAGELTAFTGRYRNEEIRATYDASLDGGVLILRLADGPHFELRLNPLGPDLFENDGDIIRFDRTAKGRVTGFRFSLQGARELPFARTSQRSH